jgi:hypothetical protein
MLSTFLTPSKPRGPLMGAALIEQQSLPPAKTSGLRPRAWPT